MVLAGLRISKRNRRAYRYMNPARGAGHGYAAVTAEKDP